MTNQIDNKNIIIITCIKTVFFTIIISTIFITFITLLWLYLKFLLDYDNNKEQFTSTNLYVSTNPDNIYEYPFNDNQILEIYKNKIKLYKLYEANSKNYYCITYNDILDGELILVTKFEKHNDITINNNNIYICNPPMNDGYKVFYWSIGLLLSVFCSIIGSGICGFIFGFILVIFGYIILLLLEIISCCKMPKYLYEICPKAQPEEAYIENDNL